MPFIRSIFFVLSFLFSMLCATQLFGTSPIVWGIGALGGLTLFAGTLGVELYFNRLSIKQMNTLSLGLLFGYFIGLAFSTVSTGIFEIVSLDFSKEIQTAINVFAYTFGIYMGLALTVRSSEELHLSIPFVKLKPTSLKKKDILLDPSILQDSRVIDLASSGLVDSHLLFPKFALKELYYELENGEENERFKARRGLDVLKRLESMKELELRYIETDFPEVKDPVAKLIRLARLLDSNIITSDITRIQQSTIESVEGIRIVNLRSLANALKPLTQSGETIQIKIQRYGKESRQGVGYLEDGTMVVVNGGAEYLGEIIKAHVLSVKHTSSGRMIFCNAIEDGVVDYDDDLAESQFSMHSSQ